MRPRLIEFRPGVFAREGETCTRGGVAMVFVEGRWRAPVGSQYVVPPDLRGYTPPKDERSRRMRRKNGWGNGTLEGLE